MRMSMPFVLDRVTAQHSSVVVRGEPVRSSGLSKEGTMSPGKAARGPSQEQGVTRRSMLRGLGAGVAATPFQSGPTPNELKAIATTA